MVMVVRRPPWIEDPSGKADRANFQQKYPMLTALLIAFLAPPLHRGWHGSFPLHDETLLGEASML